MGGLDAVCELEDCVAEVFGAVAEFNLVCEGAGDELAGEVETALVDVCDDEGSRAGSLCAEEGNEANGTSTAYKDGVTELDVCAVETSEGNRKRLKHGAVLEGHAVRHLVAPHGGVLQVAAEQTSNGGCGEELDRLAAVVAACQAGLALVADDVGDKSDAVADPEVRDGLVDSHYYTGRLVAENVCVLNNHRANATLKMLGLFCMNVENLKMNLYCASFVFAHKDGAKEGSRKYKKTYSVPEVDVTSANTSALDVQKNLTNCEISTPLDNLQTGLCLSNPQVMLWVCVNTNVCLSRRNCGCCAHLAALCLKSKDWEEKMSEEGIPKSSRRNRRTKKKKSSKGDRQLLILLRGISIRGAPRRAARCTPLSPNVTPCPARRLEWVEKPTNGNPPTPRSRSFGFGALPTGREPYPSRKCTLVFDCHAAVIQQNSRCLAWC